MKKIPLTQGLFALVDDTDYDWLMQWKWSAHQDHKGKTKRDKWYVVRHENSKPGRPLLLMHRVILDAPKERQVDHIDNDGLNNQRTNLRVATNRQNSHNRGRYRNNTSGFKGVHPCYDNKKHPWRAQIFDGHKIIELGSFATAEEAARAYDEAALRLHGAFAVLNFPNPTSRVAPTSSIALRLIRSIECV